MKDAMKMNTIGKSAAALVAASLISACSGGGGGSLTPAPRNSSPSTTPSQSKSSAKVSATIKIRPNTKGSQSKSTRKPEYVSPATSGLVVVINDSTGAQYSVEGYTLAHGQSEPNSTCGAPDPSTGAFTCTLYFNAPVGNDTYFIYAYNQGEYGTITGSQSTPSGDLLSEDIGPGGTGDPGSSAVVANQDNTETFTLLPVANDTQLSLNHRVMFGTLVLSAPGTGGTSNALSVDGLDADGYPISSYLDSAQDDSTYVDPISVAASSKEFVPSVSSITNAVTTAAPAANQVTVTYTPSSGDAPTSATSTPVSATLTMTAALTGAGFNAATTFDNPETATVAPLFAYNSSAVTTGFPSNINVYALQAGVPTGASGYTLTAEATAGTNDCSTYTIGTKQTGAGSGQQAYWAVSTDGTAAAGTTCTVDLSDGISTVKDSLATTGSNATIAVPQKQSHPTIVQTTSGSFTTANNSFQTSGGVVGKNAGDTMFCFVSFTGEIYYYSNDPSPVIGGKYKSHSPALIAAFQPVDSANDPLKFSSDPNDSPSGQGSYWCTELAGTSTDGIANDPAGDFAIGQTTDAFTPGAGQFAVSAFATANSPMGVATQGWQTFAQVVNAPTNLNVQVLQGSTSTSGSYSNTFAGVASNDFNAIVFAPYVAGGDTPYSTVRRTANAKFRTSITGTTGDGSTVNVIRRHP